jgi:chemotaxis protein methyltransferase CheR
MDDDQFKQILNRFDYSWSGYRKVRKGVKKRLTRHMQQLNCPNTGAYLDLLDASDKVRQECEMRMTVSISRFFRDRKLWQDLEENILPAMIAKEGKRFQVWSAGCARGEEVYSIKILWDRLKHPFDDQPELVITATDMHPDYIEKARVGEYTKSSMKEVPPEIQKRYFDVRKSDNCFAVKPALKKGINWKVHNILDGFSESRFNIIFLRNNLLTYYQDVLKTKGLNNIVRSLVTGGCLILGSHEKLPAQTRGLQRHRSIPWAYRKVSHS